RSNRFRRHDRRVRGHAQGLRRAAHHLLRPALWPFGGDWLYAERRYAPRFQHAKRPTIVRKPVSPRTLKSDLARIDAHSIRPREYVELPELTEEALSRATVKKGGRPRSTNPRKLISIRLPLDVIERWRATSPGWQTRIAARLSKVR